MNLLLGVPIYEIHIIGASRTDGLTHYRIFTLPRNQVVVLIAGRPFPAGLDPSQAVQAWEGLASSITTALQAAF